MGWSLRIREEVHSEGVMDNVGSHPRDIIEYNRHAKIEKHIAGFGIPFT